MITIEDYVDELSRLMIANMQSHINAVNTARKDMDLIDFNQYALSLYDMREMPNYPIGYMIDIDDSIEPVTSGDAACLSAKRVTFKVLIVIPDNALDNFRKRAIRYCEVLERWYASSVRSSVLFKSSVYKGIFVSPPLVFISGGGQQVIASSIEFSVVISD